MASLREINVNMESKEIVGFFLETQQGSLGSDQALRCSIFQANDFLGCQHFVFSLVSR